MQLKRIPLEDGTVRPCLQSVSPLQLPSPTFYPQHNAPPQAPTLPSFARQLLPVGRNEHHLSILGVCDAFSISIKPKADSAYWLRLARGSVFEHVWRKKASRRLVSPSLAAYFGGGECYTERLKVASRRIMPWPLSLLAFDPERELRDRHRVRESGYFSFSMST